MLVVFFFNIPSRGRWGQRGKGRCLASATCIISATVTPRPRCRAHVLTANSQRSLEKAKSKEGSWSLASSSASLALRLQSASLSFCLIGADGEEGQGCRSATTWSPPTPHPPITLTSLWAKNSDGPGHFAQDPGSASDGGRARCHSSRADVTWSLRCEEGAGAQRFKYLFSFYSSLYLPSLMSHRERFFFFLSWSPYVTSIAPFLK